MKLAASLCAAAALLAAAPLAHASDDKKPAVAPPLQAHEAVAIFAGGCFWCMAPAFEKLPGVSSVLSGYTGGGKSNPTYEEVSAGGTGHTEAVRVVYDPSVVAYDKLVHVFWRNVDPTDAGGQFCDRGSQYRPAIYVYDLEQRRIAQAQKSALNTSGKLRGKIVVPILSAKDFWPAENYHQRYHLKNPWRYKSYKLGCGREQRLRALWGDEAECACHEK